jgi:hypothetical protein
MIIFSQELNFSYTYTNTGISLYRSESITNTRKPNLKGSLIPHFLFYFLNKGAGYLWTKETEWRSLWKFGDKSGKHCFSPSFKKDRCNKGNQVLLLLLLLWKRSERTEPATCETRFHSHVIQKWPCCTHRYLLHHARRHLIWVEPFCKNIPYTWRLWLGSDCVVIAEIVI